MEYRRIGADTRPIKGLGKTDIRTAETGGGIRIILGRSHQETGTDHLTRLQVIILHITVESSRRTVHKINAVIVQLEYTFVRITCPPNAGINHIADITVARKQETVQIGITLVLILGHGGIGILLQEFVIIGLELIQHNAGIIHCLLEAGVAQGITFGG